MSSGNYNPKEYWEERAKMFGVFAAGHINKELQNYNRMLTKRVILKILKNQDKLSKLRVLDVGCGTGWSTILLNNIPSIEEIIAFDIAKNMIMIARNQAISNPKVHFICADTKKLPFHANSFDLVTSIRVLQHVVSEKDFRESVKEIVRVTKKNGRILIIEQIGKRCKKSKYLTVRSKEDYIDAFKGCIFVDKIKINPFSSFLLKILEGFNSFKFKSAKTRVLENTSIRNDITSFSLVLKIILKISKPIDLIPFAVPDLILGSCDTALLFKKVV